jgi:hypothetical protein
MTKEQRLAGILLLGSIVAIFIFHLIAYEKGIYFQRALHLGAAVHYTESGIDLLRPHILGFNANNVATPQEFPLWQAGASLLISLTHSLIGANLFSLLCFLTCLPAIYLLAKKVIPEVEPLLAVLVFSCTPLVFLYAGMAAVDIWAVANMLWFAYCGILLYEGGSACNWVAGLVFASLSALSKFPFYFSTGLALGLFCLIRVNRSGAGTVRVITLGLVSGVLFLLWNKWIGHMYSLAEYPHVQLSMSENPGMVGWYFGTWETRLDPGMWVRGAWRFCFAVCGGLSLCLIPLCGFFRIKWGFAHFWLAGSIITLLIFSNLVLRHWHYYLMFIPAMSMFSAWTLHQLLKFLMRQSKWPIVGLVFFVLLAGNLIMGLNAMNLGIYADPYLQKMAVKIQENTNCSDKLILLGNSWGGSEFIYSDRRGHNASGDFFDDPDYLPYMIEAGYNKFAVIGESPYYLDLLNRSPFRKRKNRASSKDRMPLILEKYPTLYEDQNLIIKELVPNINNSDSQ